MAKKKPAAGDDTPAAFLPRDDDERDLVSFYARLTRTLENVCGRDALADALARRRTAASVKENGGKKPSGPALGRAFRRLGLAGSDIQPEAFADEFSGKVGESVTRPPEQVLYFLELFCVGDDRLGMRPVCGATPQCLSCQLTRECDYFNNPRKPEMALLTPSERLMSGNAQALSDTELLALAMFGEKATGQETVVTTMLARYGRLRAVFRAEAHEYMGVRDMGKPQALRLAAMAALHRRLLAEQRDEMLRITCAKDIHDRYAPELRDYRTEAAVVLLLDQQNSVIRDAWFCDGSPNMAQVGIAELLRPAIREFACRIALVHNHPSNNPSPSASDFDFTRRLRTACDILGIGLVDHVIVAESGYYSFAEQGMLGV